MSKIPFSMIGVAALLGLAGCSSSGGGTGTASSVDPLSACISQWGAQPFEANMDARGSDAGAATVTAHLETASPSPPQVLDNDWVLSLTDQTGNPVVGAKITLRQWMPLHGHGGVKSPKVTDNGDGTYDLNPVNFSMTGFWQNTFTVVTNDGATTQDVAFDICIQ